MISFNEISYRIFNIVIPKISDDETIDISEIKYDVETARAMLIKRRYGSSFRSTFPEAICQQIKRLEVISVESGTSTIDSGRVLMRTRLKVPKLLERKSGLPMVKRISPSTILSGNMSLVTPQQAIYSGNGKFNQRGLFCFYEDDYLYIVTKRDLYKGLKYIDVHATFERPSLVNQFITDNYSTVSTAKNFEPKLPLNDNSEFPISGDMVDEIEQIIINNKLRPEAAQPIDDINDASDTQNQIQNPER